MADVVGIVFQSGSKVYFFDPASLELARGDQVVVQTMQGTEIGEVVEDPRVIPDEDLPAPLKRVVRKANVKDLEAVEANKALRLEALQACRDLIAKHGLNMKLVDAEIAFGGGKITFSFYSEERVDFRALVSDLAKALKMRIELRQIGAREEARLIGGLGPCGRNLCCSTFQGNQDPVSIRMAKEQNLPLNPMKISGLCGRLMCCLKYEHDQYVCFRKEAPNRGTRVATDQGEGVVIGYQAAKEALTLRMGDGSTVDAPIHRCSCDGAPCAPAREGEEPFDPVAAAAASVASAAPDGDGGSTRPEGGRGNGRGGPEERPSAASAEPATSAPAATAPTAPAPDATAPADSGEGDAPAEEGSRDGGDARRRSGRSRRRRRSRRPSGGGQGGAQPGGGGGAQPGGQGG
ncbi:MAG: PSP1 domain-containing protein [Thermoleophilia bacterium]